MRSGSSLAALMLLVWPAAGAAGASPALAGEQAAIARWRSERVESLTSDSGWLTLAGLFWLKEGDNTFGRAAGNSLVLDNAALADAAGSFVLSGRQVRFVARPGSGVSHDGREVTTLDLTPDSSGHPTVLASGALRFYVIERAGNLGVRVRDLNNPHRTGFRGLEYFPVSADWVVNARFERYTPVRHIRIINILGMELEMDSPGAVVFTRNGREWRLDTVLEEPGDQELFIMFADATSGHETYGAGRFLYIPLPAGDSVPVDFNKAYNPPCALNEFATCPLPPWQNRLKLKVTAGEKKYAGGIDHHL
ncbi:MAG TPA: DUF1684 domain-containing protein [Steroidobacteraceae bacterium]|nr:DUF1684 domain-containing protein [Steroidobacteraceae bacterium]